MAVGLADICCKTTFESEQYKFTHRWVIDDFVMIMERHNSYSLETPQFTVQGHEDVRFVIQATLCTTLTVCVKLVECLDVPSWITNFQCTIGDSGIEQQRKSKSITGPVNIRRGYNNRAEVSDILSKSELMKSDSQFLVNGALILVCEVEVLKHNLHQYQLGSITQQDATPPECKHLFPSKLSDLWRKESYCDVTLAAKGRSLEHIKSSLQLNLPSLTLNSRNTGIILQLLAKLK